MPPVNFQGPYTVKGRVGAVNYRLQQPGKQASAQLYHINLLNPWTEPIPSRTHTAAVTPPDQPQEQLLFNEELSLAQRRALKELE